MKRGLAWLGSAMLVLFLLTACSGGGGGSDDSDDTGSIPDPSGPPANVTVSVIPNLETDTFTIIANVTDSSGAPVNNGTPVVFNASSGDLSTLQNVTDGGEARTVLSNPEATSVTIEAIVNASVSGEATLNISGPPAAIVVTTGLPPNAFLAPGESTSVTAYVTDVVGQPVFDGTPVYFSSNSVVAVVEDLAYTRDGFATAHFTAGPGSENVTVTAATEVDPQTGFSASDTTVVPVTDGQAASITFVSVSPEEFIGIRGSGQNQVAELLFQVFDAAGNPIPDGTEIQFSLPLGLNGGACLIDATAATPNCNSARAFTFDGEVSARVQSGTVAGPLRVVASFTNAQGTVISTQGIVAVVSGPPDNEHITISQELFNQSGFVREGLENGFNVTLADRYGNVIKDGTPVSFISDCGRIGINADGVDQFDSFLVTTEDGAASAQFLTSNPVKELCTIVAYTPGEEAYDDFNGNGVYEAGIDICTGDADEPYIDENLNGSYTPGEIFIDTNGNGRYDTRNGQCDMATLIWSDANLQMSAFIGELNIEFFDPDTGLWGVSSDFDLEHGDILRLRFSAQDTFGNALVSGTTVSVDASTCPPEALALGATGLEVDSAANTATITLPDRLGEGDLFGVVLRDRTVHAVDETPGSCQVNFKINPPDNTTTTGDHGGVPRSQTMFIGYGLDLTAP